MKKGLSILPLNQVNKPGAYLDLKTGKLFRVPKEGLRKGDGSIILINSERETLVSRLSDDPYIPRAKAKLIAANHNLWINI